MIERYGLTSYGFDPTKRHVPVLRALAAQSDGHFTYHERAVGSHQGQLTFFESKDNVSGSMVSGHRNLNRDMVEEYTVEVITIADAIALTNTDVDVVKMDIEGAEEGALEACPDDVLRSVGQWCIEFHHVKVPSISYGDTRRHIRRFASLGFRSFSRNGTDFLFYQP